ncbi:hypothetical protein P4E94_13625 [Pontiellaceae bacterium B12219]|nr:hypothetical protein [Pontiellaceae bacterium B12219]
MRRKISKMLMAVAVQISFCMALVCSAQTKSSFEIGDFTGWSAQGSGWSIYGRAASDGNKSAMCEVSKGEAPGLKACAKLIDKAEPGWIVTADLDIAGKNKAGSSRAKISVVCLDAAGSILAEVEKVVSKPSTDFKKVVVPELLVPSGTKQTYLMLMVEVTEASKAKEWWRFDNISIVVK